MDAKNRTEIRAEKGKQELFIVREFDASRKDVFRAFSDPEIFKMFWGPEETLLKIDRYDFKQGGFYRYSNCDKAGNELCAYHGVVHEVTAPERFIQTSEFENLPERGHVVLETFLFEELKGGQTRLTIHEVCKSVADRDAMLASNMESGIMESFQRLDALLITVKGVV